MRRRFHARLAVRFARARDGLAAVEMALFAPLLTLLLLGGYDLSRYILLRAAVDKVGFAVADVTAQYDTLNAAAMAQVFKVTGASLPSYVSGQNGVTILTSIYLNSSNVPKVKWQCYSTAGSAWSSAIGSEGGTAAVNAELLADQNDNLMVSEVYYKFTPVFSRFFSAPITIYTSSTYRPRLGALTTKPCT